MRRPVPKALSRRLAGVRLFLCDVDGVLTDGTVTMGDDREYKRFHIQDGLGLRLLQREGIRVGWVSARPSSATAQRAADLKVDFLHQDKAGKVAAVEGILAQARLDWAQVCYVGDDVVDLGPLRRAGVAVAVANAIAEARAVAHYVTRAHGGQGAVREVADLILRAQGRWERLIQEFSA
ncbi:MAG: hypothetical protein RJA22_3283 [Verrucomicrobiota bacterium]|jgi:3-deoxy-D-manno-octulosonate 8-phosphate phosphatase (KDO 8-P phosphatase)